METRVLTVKSLLSSTRLSATAPAVVLTSLLLLRRLTLVLLLLRLLRGLLCGASLLASSSPVALLLRWSLWYLDTRRQDRQGPCSCSGDGDRRAPTVVSCDIHEVDALE